MSRKPINAVMSDSALMAWLERYYPLPAAGSSGGSGTPGGSNTQVQYNNAGSFAGSSNFTFDGTDVTIANDLYVGASIIHNGDTDTEIGFGTNTQTYTCANSERMKLNSVGVGLMGATPIAGLAVTGDLTISGDTTLGDASGDSLTINAQTINPANITTGTDDSVVVYNGSSLVTDEINSAVWDTSATFVDASGGASTRVGVFSDSNTIAGSAELTYDGSVLLVSDAAAKLKVRDTTSDYQVTLLAEAGPRIQFGDHDTGDADFMTIGAFSNINQIDTESRDFHLYGTNTTTGFYFDESAGYFGIGTDEPKAELHIAESDGSPQLRLSDTNATTNQAVVAYTEYWKGDNTTRIGWAGYGTVGNENFVINNQTATGSFAVMTNSTTALTVDYQGNATVAGDLTASADLLVSGGDITLGAATSYIRDPQGHQRISIAGTGNIVLYDASGGTEFTVANGTCTAAGNLTVSGDLFVNDYARIDALRIGTTSTDPGVDGNLYIEGATTAVGQITPGYDPQLLAQNIFDPSSYALYTIVNDADYLYIVDWDTGATSTTDPKIAFSAPASGKVIVDVTCYIDDTSTSGAGPYIYAALSSNFGGAGTKISKTDASIVGNGEKIIWYPDESDRGVRTFSFYVSGLTGGDTYTWYLYMRRYNDGDANRVICGGSYPMFEMSVRPIYSSALIYTT